jgi:sulfoxide reductase heme-binding subunit YedZ
LLNSILGSKWTKVPVFLLCLGPLAWLGWKGWQNELTANPIEFVTHATGDWTLRFLIITLAVTPFRRMFRLPQLIRFRRMLGLFAFFYGCLHFTTYVWLDQFFDVASMWKDVHKRPFITAGFTGFVLLVPLAITSTAGWIRRLGGRRWQWLHRAVYVSACAGVIHYYWQVKSDVRKPLQYAWMVGLLLVWRLGYWIYRRQRQPKATGVPGAQLTTAEAALERGDRLSGSGEAGPVAPTETVRSATPSWR